ncbi:Uncharacterised protein [Mycobacteroides abscessus subsp. abscessus]|nr:Uncharacterised protein [Mycobacteroides abscessus subsp. abscessus]SKT24593.1 Uncharacterised protein [Mycobacteroides abscessus subsp. abscessus]
MIFAASCVLPYQPEASLNTLSQESSEASRVRALSRAASAALPSASRFQPRSWLMVGRISVA